jgi:hypothetical protein
VAALSAVDWGASSRDDRDVGLGGVVGIALASATLAALALVTVAGFQPRSPEAAPIATFGAVLGRGIGGRPGAAALFLFSLGSLAPGAFAGFTFGWRFHELYPRWRRLYWELVGSVLATALIAAGGTRDLPTLFTVVGAIAASIAGILSAEFYRTARGWPGPRQGVNLAGIVALLVGVAVGLLPVVGPLAGFGVLARVQPAAVLAFAAAFLVNFILARLGLEPPPTVAKSPSPE